MNKSSFSLSNSYTFIELIISLVILSFLLGSLFFVLLAGDRSWGVESTLLDLQQPLRQAIEGMVRELREGSVRSISITDGGSKITFTIPSIGTVSYYLSASNLIREYPVGVTRQIASNITQLSFSQSDRMITVSVLAEKSYKGRNLSFRLTQQAYIRNE